MLNRRSFLKSLAVGSASLALKPENVLARATRDDTLYFGIHPFIEQNPDAVFILRTSVDQKTNAAAKKQAGIDFSRSVFLPMSTAGISIASRVVIKPNIVMMPSTDPAYLGIVTDVYFVEGVIETLKSLGIDKSRMFLRDISGSSDFAKSGYADMAARTGVDLRDLSEHYDQLSPADLQWMDAPDGPFDNRPEVGRLKCQCHAARFQPRHLE